jgi:hypothetical protein
MQMTSPNLQRMCADLKAHEVSDDFVRGALFLFAATLMRGPSIPKCHAWQQWLFAHDVHAVAQDLLGRMTERPITRAIEEFLFKLGVELPVRDMQAGGRVRPVRLLKPADHRLLPVYSSEFPDLASLSTLYFAMTEAIGRALARSEYTAAECYLFGFALFGMWWRMDAGATDAIIERLDRAAPPVLKFFFGLPKYEADYQAGWLPTQMALAGLLQGLNESFTQGVWPWQSRLFYNKAGQPIAGVEQLDPAAFFDHCYAAGGSFLEERRPDFSRILEPQIDLRRFPFWTGTKAERAAMADCMRTRWGYSPSQPGLNVIEQKQVNACTIMLQFCSMWKRAVRR